MPTDRPSLSAYPYITPITTRWMDNDIYGHINNVAYYSFFDTAANQFLIERGGLAIENAAIIGLVVESKCEYHAPLAYPQSLRAGVRHSCWCFPRAGTRSAASAATRDAASPKCSPTVAGSW